MPTELTQWSQVEPTVSCKPDHKVNLRPLPAVRQEASGKALGGSGKQAVAYNVHFTDREVEAE